MTDNSTTDKSETSTFRTVTVNEMRQAAIDASHPIPEIDLPDGWERNEPMCDRSRSEIGLRNEEFNRFIEIISVDPLTETQFDGPYYIEALIQHGGPESFETRLVERPTGVEPGAIQDEVTRLATTLETEKVKHF